MDFHIITAKGMFHVLSVATPAPQAPAEHPAEPTPEPPPPQAPR